MKIANISLLYFYFSYLCLTVYSSESKLKLESKNGIFGSLKAFKGVAKTSTLAADNTLNINAKIVPGQSNQIAPQQNSKIDQSKNINNLKTPHISFAQKSGASASTLKKGNVSDFVSDDVNNGIGKNSGSSTPLTVGPISWKGWIKYKSYKNVDEESIVKGNGSGKVMFARNDYFIKQKQINSNIDLNEKVDEEYRYVKDETSFYLSLFNHVITINSSREVSSVFLSY